MVFYRHEVLKRKMLRYFIILAHSQEGAGVEILSFCHNLSFFLFSDSCSCSKLE